MLAVSRRSSSSASPAAGLRPPPRRALLRLLLLGLSSWSLTVARRSFGVRSSASARRGRPCGSGPPRRRTRRAGGSALRLGWASVTICCAFGRLGRPVELDEGLDHQRRGGRRSGFSGSAPGSGPRPRRPRRASLRPSAETGPCSGRPSRRRAGTGPRQRAPTRPGPAGSAGRASAACDLLGAELPVLLDPPPPLMASIRPPASPDPTRTGPGRRHEHGEHRVDDLDRAVPAAASEVEEHGQSKSSGS